MRKESARERVFAFLDREVENGRQIYVVYPIIEESEKTDLKAATTMFDRMKEGPLRNRRIALLHGRIPADERDATMRAFRDGRIDVLVATTVIEVGIDVPNATVMVVEHPERFGLSQLHQLRGRVGRGAEQSYSILLGDVSPDAASRLSVFVNTEDGFDIARADLRLRGMGELFGERQSGVPTFKVADPIRDEALSEQARAAAERVLNADPELTKPENRGILRVLAERYAKAMEMFKTG
jgi:ATP-dependent DNA helicase RecG